MAGSWLSRRPQAPVLSIGADHAGSEADRAGRHVFIVAILSSEVIS